MARLFSLAHKLSAVRSLLTDNRAPKLVKQIPSPVTTTYHGLNLPQPAIALASQEGQQLFQEAFCAGSARGCLSILPVLEMQPELTFCGAASLSSVLNALKVDPQRVWNDRWRWYTSHVLLQGAEMLEKARDYGLTLPELSDMALANSAEVRTHYASESSRAEFTRLLAGSASSGESYIIANYSRKVVKQAGSVHHAPLAAYHADRELALVLEVAKYKYPCHWLPMDLLWTAMDTIDEESGRTRGFMVVSRQSEDATS